MVYPRHTPNTPVPGCPGGAAGLVLAVAVVLALALALATPSQATASEDARHALDRGEFETAARLYETRLEEDPAIEDQCAAHLGLGEAYRLAQRTQKARGYYRQATDTGQPEPCVIRARIGLGVTRFLDGDLLAAGSTLEHALSEARQYDDPSVIADALNAVGGVLAASNRFSQAQRYFEEAAALDGASGLARARAYTGLAALTQTRGGDADSQVEKALDLLASAPDSYLKGLTLLELADLKSPQQERALSAATAVARALDNVFLQSASLGRTARFAIDQGDIATARALTQKALFQAQSIQNAELMYLWNWQMGRIQTGDAIAEAVTSYALAMDAFELVRDELIRRYRFEQKDFRETFGAFFLEYAGLLMTRESNDEARLRDARGVIETFKSAELQDYFLDDCVGSARQSATLSAEPGIAVVYPIIQPDRLDILVETEAGLSYTAVPVSGRALSARLGRFRRQLQSFQPGYRETGRALHDWLIAPIREQIAHAQVLVIVPDAALRLIPFSALYDGERFLIQNHAVVVTPGLSVTIAGETPDTSRIVLAGLTENVQGYDPLPGVAAEIQALSELYGTNGVVLLNAGFNSEQLNRVVAEAPLSILHLASHAEFGGDRQDTFVLTWDGRLDLDQLETLVRASSGGTGSLALLTLAACQTAMGDDRAALGLAGVAVKAGASSALATLWSVADESASKLMVAFYSGLRGNRSRALALREAQLQLLNSDEYSHPGHWSAFMLIGDWH